MWDPSTPPKIPCSGWSCSQPRMQRSRMRPGTEGSVAATAAAGMEEVATAAEGTAEVVMVGAATE
eukprot:scaffold81030_cov45-Phaeocystis_antarctica.AAC.2